MHSHDNTRLAQFGFQDPDRKLKKHALACQYLSRGPVSKNKPSRARKVLNALGIEFGPFQARCEASLSKGEGQYKTTIGFVDVQYETPMGDTHDGYAETSVIGIEVKITPCAWDVALRQINLYREYAPTIPGQPSTKPKRRWGDKEEPLSYWHAWILAVAFPMTTSDVESLRTADVHVLRLGEKFERWLERRDRKKNAELPEV